MGYHRRSSGGQGSRRVLSGHHRFTRSWWHDHSFVRFLIPKNILHSSSYHLDEDDQLEKVSRKNQSIVYPSFMHNLIVDFIRAYRWKKKNQKVLNDVRSSSSNQLNLSFLHENGFYRIVFGWFVRKKKKISSIVLTYSLYIEFFLFLSLYLILIFTSLIILTFVREYDIRTDVECVIESKLSCQLVAKNSSTETGHFSLPKVKF